MPLSFAVRQVVPKGISARFAPTVDAETPVNWKGGRPWPVVLKDLLKPANLQVTFRAGTVFIEPWQQG